MDRRRKFKVFFVAAFLVFILDNVSAFGVSYSFICPDDPVRVFPGQETSVELKLQNMGVGEGDDLTVAAVMRNDAGIAVMENKKYVVRANTKDTVVSVKIKIPDNAMIGTNYTITTAFDTVSSGESGGVAVGTGMDVKICVEVVPEFPVGLSPTGAKTFNVNVAVLIAAIIIILAVIIVLIILKRRKRNSVWLNGGGELSYKRFG